MTWEHERVEELLAAHALGGLDAEDAALAERALVEHVPECDRCRRAWDGYRDVAADLALAAPAVGPPDTLEARLRRSIAAPPRRRARIRSWAAPAAAAVVLLGLSTFTLLHANELGAQLEATRQDNASLLGALTTVAHPGHRSVPLSDGTTQRAALYYVPGEEEGYLMATNLPKPRHQYHVWFVENGRPWHAGVLRVRDGRAVLPCRTDPSRWDAVMLTDEPGRPAPRTSPIASGTVAPE